MKGVIGSGRLSPRTLLAAATLAILLAVPTVVDQPSVKSRLAQLGVLPVPEQYVELFFAGPLDIDSLVVGDGRVAVTFGVRSALAETTDLSWQVGTSSAPNLPLAHVAREGALQLAPGTSEQTAVTVPVDCEAERTALIVEVAPSDTPAQRIHLWVLRDALVKGGRCDAS